MGVRTNLFVLPFVFLLFVSLIHVQSQVDANMIGVNDGDTFEITITEASGDLSKTYSINEVIGIEVIDASPDSDNYINLQLTRGDDSIENSKVRLDEFGSMIVYTDWNYWEENSHDALLNQYEEDFNIQMDSAQSSSGSNGPNFQVDMEITFSTGTVNIVIDYDRATGIISQYYLEMNFIEFDGAVRKGVLAYQNNDPSGPDKGKIGVKAGDIFEFELLAFPTPEDEDLVYDDDYQPPQIGDIITFEVLSTELNELNEISVQLSEYDGTTDVQEVRLDRFGEAIIFADWEYWEKSVVSYNSYGFFGQDDPETMETTVRNSASVFEVSTTFDFSDEYSDISGFNKISYDKATGILNEIQTSRTIKDLESGNITEFEIHIRRVGFLGDNGGGLADALPGFEMSIIGLSLFFVIIPIQKLRKNRID